MPGVALDLRAVSGGPGSTSGGRDTPPSMTRRLAPPVRRCARSGSQAVTGGYDRQERSAALIAQTGGAAWLHRRSALAGRACRAAPVGPSCSAPPRRSSSRRATTRPRWTTSPSAPASASRCSTSTSRASSTSTWPCSTSTPTSSSIGAVREALASTTRQQAAGRRHDGGVLRVRRRDGAPFRLVFESDLTNEPAVRERVDADAARLRRGDRRGDRGGHRRCRHGRRPCSPSASPAWPR